jgi:hypothetical protein
VGAALGARLHVAAAIRGCRRGHNASGSLGSLFCAVFLALRSVFFSMNSRSGGARGAVGECCPANPTAKSV